MKKIKKFFILIEFGGTLLALPFAYIGLLFAGGDDLYTWLWVTLAMISARTIGASFNKLIDLSIDIKNPVLKGRTFSPAESSKAVLWSSGILSSALLVYSSYMLNELCFYLSFAGLFLLITYSYFKRFTWATHFYLGLVEAAAPIGGFIAETGRFEAMPFILGGALLLWIAGLDIIYAVQDIDFEKSENLNSMPIKFGIENSLVISYQLYVFSVTALTVAGFMTGRGLAYWAAIICISILFIRQQSLVRSKDIQSSMIEFFQLNNLISPILFAGTFIDVMFG